MWPQGRIPVKMKEAFWNSIAAYNSATRIWQIAMAVVAAVLPALLWFRPKEWVKTVTKLYMAAVSLWIAFVYYMKYGAVRDYSNVMTIFWCLVALSWIYDLATRFSSFRKSGKYSAIGLAILVLPLAYPFISVSRGLEFPQITTPMIPSGVALYMLGMLMTFNRKINFFAFLLVMHWSVIAISKIAIFKIPEDALLAAACIPSMVIFFLQMLKDAGQSSFKPSGKYVKTLIYAVAVLLAGCMAVA